MMNAVYFPLPQHSFIVVIPRGVAWESVQQCLTALFLAPRVLGVHLYQENAAQVQMSVSCVTAPQEGQVETAGLWWGRHPLQTGAVLL